MRHTPHLLSPAETPWLEDALCTEEGYAATRKACQAEAALLGLVPDTPEVRAAVRELSNALTEAECVSIKYAASRAYIEGIRLGAATMEATTGRQPAPVKPHTPDPAEARLMAAVYTVCAKTGKAPAEVLEGMGNILREWRDHPETIPAATPLQ